MKKLLMAVAAVAAFALVGEGVEVSTVEALTAALAGSESEIVIAEGTYTITAALSVNRAVTVRAADGASVTIDGQSKCQCLSINHADAVVEGIRFYRGKVSGNGAGVAIGTNGGTLRNCIVESCKCGASNNKGPGIYLNSANALVTGCQVRECGTDGFNGDYECHGVYIDNGTLDHTLVVGCKNTNSYRDGKKGASAVYLAKGTVKNCTIVGNEVSHYGLYCADANTCHVIDTISWDNVSLRGVDTNCPNANDYGANADVVNLCLDNPMFANTTDYALAPESPCIGAGTDGGDLGWKAYDASVPAVGVKVSASKGTAPLEVTVELTSANVDLSGATIVWDGLEETGASFTKTFGGGVHALKATVTLADGAEMTAANSVSVAYPAGEYEVATAAELEAMLASPLSDGVVIRLPEGTFEILGTCYAIRNGVKIVGAGREKTILKKNLTDTRGRFFYMNHADAELDNLTLYNAMAACSAGGVWIDGRGGTVSNCTVRGCKTGASQAGGGVWMNSPNALVTHSVVSKNTVGQNTYCGGVLLSQGTLADSLIVSNTAQYYDRKQVLGAGVYMDKATSDARVVNCTIAHNKGYQGSGLYRVANAGYVQNTLIFDNTSANHDVNDDFVSFDGATLPNATAIVNCCSSVAIGPNDQVATKSPYDPVTYELDGESGGTCINKGENACVVSTTDFYGNDRIFQGKTVDIGAHEYSKTTVTVGFLSTALQGTDSVTVTFTATVQGAEIGECEIKWYLDGDEEPAGEGETFTHTFTTGRHGMRMSVTVGGQTYEKSEAPGYITVYPSHIYVDSGSTVEPAWPYGPDTPFTNINAISEMFVEGVTVHVAEGLYPMTGRITLNPNRSIVGAGMDRTVLYHPTCGRAGFDLNAPSALVADLCVSNCSASFNGGGFYVSAGTVDCCRVTHCLGTDYSNTDGGGVYLNGDNACFDRGVITDCVRWQPNGRDMAKGGGAYVAAGGLLRNTLVARCQANNAGGVYVNTYSHVINCTIVSNTCGTSGAGGGGVYASFGAPRGNEPEVVNCIVWGNHDADDSSRDDLTGCPTRLVRNCTPVDIGTDCVTADPQFKDAANGDYRIGASSPCAYAGKWQSWMEGATDFFGNPRTTPGKKVSIGYCQAPDPGLMLLVK